MKIIFFINGEPFNFFDQDARLHRVGHLIKKCQELDINYEVWTSDFYHQKQTFYNNKNINFKIIKSLGYKKNISLNRFLDNIIYSFKVYFELKKKKQEFGGSNLKLVSLNCDKNIIDINSSMIVGGL